LNTQEIIIQKLISEKARTRADFRRIVASVYRDHNTSGYDSNIDLRRTYDYMLASGDLEPDEYIEKLLITKKMRSLSGVAVVTVLTKPYPCPGKCIYCPSEENVPKSYLSDEPAVMRAILADYGARKQVETRLTSLARQGHPVDKIELIIIGGTFSYLPRDYQETFVKECFDALNGIVSNLLDSAKKMNESAQSRCVGLTLETRPDYITEDEVVWFRYLGATRVELGVQTVFDDVLNLNNRGEKAADTVKATKLLKNAGFKICYHLMPNLYGSTLERDQKMFRIVFEDDRFRPDYIKIYPCMIIAGTPLHDLWKQGKYTSYSDEELKSLIKYIKTIVPYWVRIMRTIRDIPAPNIVSGSTLSNMRQIVHAEMKVEGLSCRCIRCREVGAGSSIVIPAKAGIQKNIAKSLDSRLRGNDEGVLFIEKYSASDGMEYFLSYESEIREVLYSLLRLRLPSNVIARDEAISSGASEGDCRVVPPRNDEGKKLDAGSLMLEANTAIIREVHTYGQQVEVGESGDTQHRGYGRKLIVEAEKIAKKAGFDKLSVISGVGVRDYYRKFGYKLENEYMVKRLDA
jgi:elongator complex protein 3